MATFYFCARCNRTLDEGQTRMVRAGAASLRVCATCGDLARPETSKVVARASYPLPLEMMLAYASPFRPSSLVMLLPIAALLAFSCWSFHGLLLALVSYGVMLALVFAIVRSTGAGEDRVTLDAVFAERGEAAAVVLRYLFLVLVCLAPVGVAWALGLPWPCWAAAIVIGYAYFPAGLIAASQEAARPFDPLLGYRVILAFPAPYFVAVACMTPAAAVWLGAPWIATALTDGRPAAALEQTLSLFAFAVVARICGILMRQEA